MEQNRRNTSTEVMFRANKPKIIPAVNINVIKQLDTNVNAIEWQDASAHVIQAINRQYRR